MSERSSGHTLSALPYRSSRTCAYKVYFTQSVYKAFFRSQLPHRSVNLLFTITNIKHKLTDLCGNLLVQNDFKNILCGIEVALSVEGMSALGSRITTHILAALEQIWARHY